MLNLLSGRRAKATAAWGPARGYFETAVSLGGDDAWSSHRDEMYGAVKDLAECDFLTGRFDQAAERFDDLRRRAVSRAERAGVVTLHVRLLVVTGRYDDALALAAQELEAFGAALPSSDAAIVAAIEDGHRRLAHFDVRAMEELPLLGDSEPRALINLLASLPPAVYSRRPELLPLLAMKIVELSIDHGNCEASCFGYSMYAMILAATLGEPARARALSTASIALNDRLEDPRLRAPAIHIHANHILFWSHPYEAAVPYLLRAYDAAMHVGDITIAAYAAFMGAWQEIERGHAIPETQAALERHDARAQAARHVTARDVVRLQRQFGRALAGDTLDPLHLSSSDFDAEAARARIATAGLDTGLAMHDLLYVMLAWLHGRFAEAEALLERGSTTLAAAYCLPLETTWALFDALTAAASWDDAAPHRRDALVARLRKTEARLGRWAQDCPANFEAKHALVVAELARVEGRMFDAHREYERAFSAARRSGMLHLQAITSRIASRVALASGLEHAGRSWLREQYDVLSAWGAKVLLAQLDEAHPHLRSARRDAIGGAVQLDALAAIKSSQALSRAVDIDDLAQTLLRVVMENAGAQRAVLLLPLDGRLQTAASTTSTPGSSEDARAEEPEVPAAITSGKVELKLGPLEVADVVARAIEVSSPLLELHRHELIIQVPRQLFVNADSDRLVQVVSNLVTNAAKYTPPGGRILVRVQREGDQAEIVVIDNGIGIEAEMLPRVFEPFAQARQSLDRARGGLGLGLAIVSNLVKLHGGTVRAKSQGRGQGSEFSVHLPLIDPPDGVEILSPELPAVQGAGARVLVVDDNVDAAEMLADLLEMHGYRTVVAHDGPSALTLADDFHPQIALLDLGLPVMDGFELARILQARPALASTRLIAITGYGQPEDRAKTAAAGFAGHMTKPVSTNQLRTLMEQLLSAAAGGPA